MLTDKKIVITGVVRQDSIAHAIAEHAQLLGADILLTAFPRDLELARETAARLPRAAEVLPVDLTDPDDVATLTHHCRRTWGKVDAAVHAVAFAPRDALAGDLLDTPVDSVARAFHTSTFSYATLGGFLRDLAPAQGGSLVGLDFDAASAWPIYNWMGVCKAALESLNRYLARDLGLRNIRTNLVAAGPIHTRAASGIPEFERLLSSWESTAPLRWDPEDTAQVAEAVCFLLSDMSRSVTGEILHVDGGHHAMAAPLRPASEPVPGNADLTDREKLAIGLGAMSRHGITTRLGLHGNPAQLGADLRADIIREFPGSLGSYVFATEEITAAFDPTGRLVRPLQLHVSDAAIGTATAGVLRDAGLFVSGHDAGMVVVSPAAVEVRAS